MDKREKKDNPDEKVSGYCQITRERVDNFIKMFEDFKNNDFKGLVKDFKGLGKEVKEMGKRPSWTVSTIIWILSSLAVGLLVRTIILGM